MGDTEPDYYTCQECTNRYRAQDIDDGVCLSCGSDDIEPKFDVECPDCGNDRFRLAEPEGTPDAGMELFCVDCGTFARLDGAGVWW